MSHDVGHYDGAAGAAREAVEADKRRIEPVNRPRGAVSGNQRHSVGRCVDAVNAAAEAGRPHPLGHEQHPPA
jgi:hypothetical protein